MNLMLKSGMADAMDYAIANGNWNWKCDLALWILFLSPVIIILLVIVIAYLLYKLFKWRFMSY